MESKERLKGPLFAWQRSSLLGSHYYYYRRRLAVKNKCKTAFFRDHYRGLARVRLTQKETWSYKIVQNMDFTILHIYVLK